MSKETSEAIASVAGRVLSRGNPLDDPTFVGALIEALAASNSGQEAMQACRTAFQPYMADMLRLAGSALSQYEDETMLVPTPVDWQRVADAMVGAIEGGSTYWLNSCHASLDDNSQTLKRAIQLADNIWYAEASYWRDGGRALVKYDNPETGPSIAEKEIGKAELLLGLRAMAEKSPRHFADLVNENDDAMTHDVFIQYVLFGDIIYG